MTETTERKVEYAEVRLIVAGDCATALVPWSGFSWPHAAPRTDTPVRFSWFLDWTGGSRRPIRSGHVS